MSRWRTVDTPNKQRVAHLIKLSFILHKALISPFQLLSLKKIIFLLYPFLCADMKYVHNLNFFYDSK